MSDPRPIGVFDSGVGGLTVLQEIVRRLPSESTIYLGDNGRAPYGTRPDEEVLAFSTESIDALVERDVKAIVVACNTSTAVALQQLRRRHDVPILGVIRPGAAAAALASRNRRVGVIATPATVRSHAYFWAIKDENAAVEVYEHATPALVPLVEAGKLTGPEVDAAVADALAPLFGERDAAGDFVFPLPPSARIDTLLLGCTHYPLLRPVIAAIAGDRVAIVDSATATASALAELLSVNALEAPGTTRGTAADPGRGGHDQSVETATPPVHAQLTTGDVARFRDLATALFGAAFTDVASIELRGDAGKPRTRNSTAAGTEPTDIASRSTAGAGRPAQ
ncbi:MAG TPA: glutamate racemase [Candidatus Limnocylindrales bacterium]